MGYGQIIQSACSCMQILLSAFSVHAFLEANRSIVCLDFLV